MLDEGGTTPSEPVSGRASRTDLIEPDASVRPFRGHDHRINRASLLDPLAPEHPDCRRLPDPDLRRLHRRVRTARLRNFAWWILAPSIIIGLFFLSRFLIVQHGIRAQWLATSWVLLTLLTLVMMGCKCALKPRRREICCFLLRRQRCPACAFSLISIPMDRDNLTTCPDCGAAWLVPVLARGPRGEDARGRSVKLFDPETAQVTRARGSLDADQLKRLSIYTQTSLSALHVSVGRSIAVGIPFLLGGWCLVSAVREGWRSGDGWGQRIGTSVILGAVVITILIWWSRGRYRRRHDIVKWFAHEGHCAVCTYSLREIPADADGCTVCPECGAAWRLDSQRHEGTEGKGQRDRGTEGQRDNGTE